MKKIKKRLSKLILEFNSVGKKEKIFIFIILISCFLLGTIYPVLSARTLSNKPSDIASNQTLLTLKSSAKQTQVGKSFTVTIFLNSGKQGVEAADIVINFDPKYLKAASISTGPYFKLYPQKIVENSFVKISGTASYENNTLFISKGSGIVAEVEFKALSKTDSTQIALDKDKTIIASAGKNIWDKKIASLSLKIK